MGSFEQWCKDNNIAIPSSKKTGDKLKDDNLEDMIDTLKDFSDQQGGLAQITMLRLQNANNNANNASSTITNWMSKDSQQVSTIASNMR